MKLHSNSIKCIKHQISGEKKVNYDLFFDTGMNKVISMNNY